MTIEQISPGARGVSVKGWGGGKIQTLPKFRYTIGVKEKRCFKWLNFLANMYFTDWNGDSP
jgi:hypothetical protein